MVDVLSSSLLSGPLPVILLVLGILGGLWLLAGRRRWYQARALPLCAVGSVIVTLLLAYFIERVWHPFPDPLAASIYVYIGIAIFALALLVPRVIASGRVLPAVITVLATSAAVIACANQINDSFGAYPTVRDALGFAPGDEVSFGQVPGARASTVTGRPLAAHWTAPADLASTGTVSTAAIPGTISRFSARDAEIYLPPAYFADPRPLLPVLLLLPGQPGSPQDWLVGGRLAATMDSFAREHQGLAPVVVVADGTGSELANPLCVDSNLGNVATYLAKDVPAWVKANLQVDRDPKSWAVGGLSYGGTCSLQLATNYPATFPTFLDISGQVEPTLGSRAQTVNEAFGGDAAAFTKINPMDLMRQHRYPDTAGMIVVGSDDAVYGPGASTIYQAAKAAGMDVGFKKLPGGHDFTLWSSALSAELNWLAQKVGLIA